MLYDASKEFEVSDYKLQVDLTVRHTVSLFVEFLFDRSQFMVKITKFTEPRAKCVGVDGLNTWIRFLFVNVRERKERNKRKKYSLMIWLTLNIHFVSSWEMLLWFYRETLSNFSLERQELCFHSSPNLQTYYSPNIQVSPLKKHFFYGCRKRVLEPRSTFAWSRIDFQKLYSSASTQLQESMSLQYKEVFWG